MTQDQWIQLFTPANLVIANVIFILLILWSFVWKGIALWKAARNSSKPWFVVLLILNTLGILEILYIFVFSNMGKKQEGTLEK
jgi:hypothetical protein